MKKCNPHHSGTTAMPQASRQAWLCRVRPDPHRLRAPGPRSWYVTRRAFASISGDANDTSQSQSVHTHVSSFHVLHAKPKEDNLGTLERHGNVPASQGKDVDTHICRTSLDLCDWNPSTSAHHGNVSRVVRRQSVISTQSRPVGDSGETRHERATAAAAAAHTCVSPQDDRLLVLTHQELPHPFGSNDAGGTLVSQPSSDMSPLRLNRVKVYHGARSSGGPTLVAIDLSSLCPAGGPGATAGPSPVPIPPPPRSRLWKVRKNTGLSGTSADV